MHEKTPKASEYKVTNAFLNSSLRPAPLCVQSVMMQWPLFKFIWSSVECLIETVQVAADNLLLTPQAGGWGNG